MGFLPKTLQKNKIAFVTFVLFIILTFWWIDIYIGGTQDAPINNLFGFVYGGFSIWGGFLGIIVSKQWGGLKSLMGKAILCLSFGLLLQAFGQYSFWFHNVYLQIAVPYPGIPDIGFFGTIPFYIYAAFLLGKASGINVSLKSFFNKLQAIVIPAVMLLVGYFLFLRGYNWDFSQPLKIILDFGYPLGQAIYLSIAILTFSLSRRILGGIMRFPIFTIIVAFLFQFLSDYTFVYFQESFYPASFIDYLYLTSYFIMTIGILQLQTVLSSIKNN